MNPITPDLIRQCAANDVPAELRPMLLIIAEAMAEDRREIDRLNQEVLRLKGLTPELLEACRQAEYAFRVPTGTRIGAEMLALTSLRAAIDKAENNDLLRLTGRTQEEHTS